MPFEELEDFVFEHGSGNFSGFGLINREHQLYVSGKLAASTADQLVNAAADPVADDGGFVHLAADHDRNLNSFGALVFGYVQTA